MKYTPELIHGAFEFIKARNLGFDVKTDLMELVVDNNTSVMFGWLGQPYVEINDIVYSLDKALTEFIVTKDKKANMVLDILQGWFEQFCNLAHDKVKGEWFNNYNALEVIWYAIKNGEEFNVYVPMFDINFTNEEGDDGEGEELWPPVSAFGDFIDVAASCYEILEENSKYDSNYTMRMDERSLFVPCETTADVDREFTEEARTKAIEKLKQVKEDLAQQKLAAKMAARRVMRQADKLNARLPDGTTKSATRKLRDCLRVLRKNKLVDHVLNVDGWVVRLHRNAHNGDKYDIMLPWVGEKMTTDDFSTYVKAKKDKKCPVAWEYLYIIDKFLQNL